MFTNKLKQIRDARKRAKKDIAKAQKEFSKKVNKLASKLK